MTVTVDTRVVTAGVQEQPCDQLVPLMQQQTCEIWAPRGLLAVAPGRCGCYTLQQQ